MRERGREAAAYEKVASKFQRGATASFGAAGVAKRTGALPAASAAPPPPPSTTPSSASSSSGGAPHTHSTCGLAQSAGGIGRLRAFWTASRTSKCIGAPSGGGGAGEVGADGAPARGRLLRSDEPRRAAVGSDDGDAAATAPPPLPERRCVGGVVPRDAEVDGGGGSSAPSVRTSRAMIWRRASSASAEVGSSSTRRSRSSPHSSQPRGTSVTTSCAPSASADATSSQLHRLVDARVTGSCVDSALSLSWRMRAYVPRSGWPCLSTVHWRGIASCAAAAVRILGRRSESKASRRHLRCTRGVCFR